MGDDGARAAVEAVLAAREQADAEAAAAAKRKAAQAGLTKSLRLLRFLNFINGAGLAVLSAVALLVPMGSTSEPLTDPTTWVICLLLRCGAGPSREKEGVEEKGRGGGEGWGTARLEPADCTQSRRPTGIRALTPRSCPPPSSGSFFGTLWCTVEMNLVKAVEDRARRQVGFLFTYSGRTLYIFL